MSNIMDEEAALQAQLNNSDGDSSESENERDQAKHKQLRGKKKAVGDHADDKNSNGRRAAAGGAVAGGRKIHGRMKDVGETVLYIGHLPCILGEPELKSFLGQFGKVLHLELARSKKTNRSLGYAFCQMQSADVARVVADTLSGYLLMGEKRLVCHIVPPEKVRRSLFVPTHAKKDPHQEYLKMKKEQQTKRHNRPLEKMTAITSKLVARERKLRQNLKDMGIDYDFPGYEAAAVLAAEKKAAATGPEEGEQEHVNKEEQGKIHDDSTNTKGRKRKDSVGSVESAGKKERKRKDSIASVDDKSDERKRKDSIDSTNKKERKRKDSVGSVESAGKKERKRSDSIGSVEKNSKKEGKRKDSVGSVEEKSSSSKQGKRKDLIGSVDNSETKEARKRKESIGSVGSPASHPDSSSKKQRKSSSSKHKSSK